MVSRSEIRKGFSGCFVISEKVHEHEATERVSNRDYGEKCLLILPFTSSFNNSIWVTDTSVLEVTTNKPHGALLIDFLNNTVVTGISVSDQKACTSKHSRKT